MKTIFGILMVFLVSNLFAQEYQVLHVKGEISRAESGDLLKPGDKIGADQRISFKSNDAMAAVLNSEMGRFILKADTEEKSSGNLIYVLKSTVTPVRGGMSTRAAGINNSFDLQVYFAEAPYVWVGNFVILKISSIAFPMNEDNFFFLRYTWKGDQINKKLGYDADKLIMNKEDVFKIDGDIIDKFDVSDFQLFYYRSGNEEAELITDVDFIFVDQQSLINVYEACKDNGKYPFNDVADLFSDMYGKCDAVQVQYNIKNQ